MAGYNKYTNLTEQDEDVAFYHNLLINPFFKIKDTFVFHGHTFLKNELYKITEINYGHISLYNIFFKKPVTNEFGTKKFDTREFITKNRTNLIIITDTTPYQEFLGGRRKSSRKASRKAKRSHRKRKSTRKH